MTGAEPGEPPPTIVLETDRLLLRTWTLADIDPFHAICSDPQVMQFVQTGEPWTRVQTAAMIETALATEKQHGFSRWALIHKPDATLIGFCGFVPAEAGAEIGWRLAAPYWGQGLATEAANRASLSLSRCKNGLRHPHRTTLSQSSRLLPQQPPPRINHSLVHRLKNANPSDPEHRHPARTSTKIDHNLHQILSAPTV